MKMKIATIILVILGAIASFALGITWLSDYNDYKTEISTVNEMLAGIGSDSDIAKDLKEVETMRNCAYALIACGFIALVAVFLMGKIGKIAAIIILAAGIVPAIFYLKALAFTFLLVIAGILAFFVKPRAQTVKVE